MIQDDICGLGGVDIGESFIAACVGRAASLVTTSIEPIGAGPITRHVTCCLNATYLMPMSVLSVDVSPMRSWPFKDDRKTANRPITAIQPQRLRHQ